MIYDQLKKVCTIFFGTLLFSKKIIMIINSIQQIFHFITIMPKINLVSNLSGYDFSLLPLVINLNQ